MSRVYFALVLFAFSQILLAETTIQLEEKFLFEARGKIFGLFPDSGKVIQYSTRPQKNHSRVSIHYSDSVKEVPLPRHLNSHFYRANVSPDGNWLFYLKGPRDAVLAKGGDWVARSLSRDPSAKTISIGWGSRGSSILPISTNKAIILGEDFESKQPMLSAKLFEWNTSGTKIGGAAPKTLLQNKGFDSIEWPCVNQNENASFAAFRLKKKGRSYVHAVVNLRTGESKEFAYRQYNIHPLDDGDLATYIRTTGLSLTPTLVIERENRGSLDVLNLLELEKDETVVKARDHYFYHGFSGNYFWVNIPLKVKVIATVRGVERVLYDDMYYFALVDLAAGTLKFGYKSFQPTIFAKLVGNQIHVVKKQSKDTLAWKFTKLN